MNGNKNLGFGIAAGVLALSASARSENILERIAIAVLADKFGIDTREIVTLQQQTRLPVYELSPILEGSYYFKQRPATVWQLREQGLGWGQIAQRVGMQPGQFNKLRNQGAFDRDRFWTTSYHDRFGTSNTQISVVRQRGGTLEDVLGAIVIGKLTNKPPQDIYTRYQTERSWMTIASSQNVRFEEWQRVCAPVRTRYSLSEYGAKRRPESGRREMVRVKRKDNEDKFDRRDDDRKGKHDDDHKRKSQGKGKGKSKGKGKDD